MQMLAIDLAKQSFHVHGVSADGKIVSRRVGRHGLPALVDKLDPEVVARMVGRKRRVDPLDALTPREREVLSLMAEGLSNQGIADRLVVGAPAVEKHVTSIFSKLDLGHDRSESRRVLAVLTLLRAAG